jgi:hypothetical protein
MRGGHGLSSGEALQLLLMLVGGLVGYVVGGYASFRGMKWLLPGMPWPFAILYALGNPLFLYLMWRRRKRVAIAGCLVWFGLFALPYWYHYE